MALNLTQRREEGKGECGTERGTTGHSFRPEQQAGGQLELDVVRGEHGDEIMWGFR